MLNIATDPSLDYLRSNYIENNLHILYSARFTHILAMT